VFVGPEGEGKGGEIVNQGDGVAVFGEVDGADVVPAGIAGFDAHVRKLFGDIDRELAFGFFATGGAENAAKIPFVETKGANQPALAAVAFWAKHAEQRDRVAKRADALCRFERGWRPMNGQELGVGLQENLKSELGEGVRGLRCVSSGRVLEGSAGAPIGGEERDPGRGSLQGKLARGFDDRRRAYALQKGKKIGEVVQEDGEIEFGAKAVIGAEDRVSVVVPRKLDVEALLESCDMAVERENFRGKGMKSAEVLRAPNPRVVIGSAGLYSRHLRGADESTTSLYHPGWYLFANSSETSPRMTEPNAPRSAKTPM
jgi:hypothetical protein